MQCNTFSEEVWIIWIYFSHFGSLWLLSPRSAMEVNWSIKWFKWDYLIENALFSDIHPDIWPSQLFMIILIVISILILPSKFEELASVYVERKKSTSTSYSRQRVVREKHVVVCMNNCQNSSIMEFLNEFYAHRMLQNYCVVFLCPIELDKRLSAVFQSPMWSQRVVYIQGSALNNFDLNRAQIQFAEACFIMADRNYPNREAADQHTILRSWAIKDYAPNCVQYIHLMRPENKMHVQHSSEFYTCSQIIQLNL